MEKQPLKVEKTKLILVTGGARSGKSAFAEAYAAQAAGPEGRVAYLATAQIYDEEMKFRVQRHQARRPATWQTFEAPTEAQVLAALQESGATCDVILFDCLTLYLSNFLCSCSEDKLQDEAWLYEQVQKMADKIMGALAGMSRARALVMVTNEVGAGIVPENHLARLYRDLAGFLNQRLGAAAESVFLTVCGQALNVKKLSLTAEEAVGMDLGKPDAFCHL